MKNYLLVDSEIKLEHFQKTTQMNALSGEFSEDKTDHMSRECEVSHLVNEAPCT